jgi:hypothetical protein
VLSAGLLSLEGVQVLLVARTLSGGAGREGEHERSEDRRGRGEAPHAGAFLQRFPRVEGVPCV